MNLNNQLQGNARQRPKVYRIADRHSRSEPAAIHQGALYPARQGRRAGRIPGASAGAGSRRRAAGTDAGKPGTADVG